VFGGDVGRPLLDLAVADLDGRPAAAADQVVVMMIGATAIHRLAGVVAQRVEQARGGHRLQRPVHGGQPDVLAALPQFVVHFSLLALPKKVRIDGLQLTGVTPGASVTAVCTKKCSGSFSARAASSTVQLHIVEKKWVPVGATIDIRVTKPGSAGAWARITVTGLPHGVAVQHACLAPGSTRPTACGNFG